MKSILTFTLAAGVALTSSSIVQAAGTAKTGRTATPAPASAGSAMGHALNRSVLNRELSRLSELIGGNDLDIVEDVAATSSRKSNGSFHSKSNASFYSKSNGSFHSR